MLIRVPAQRYLLRKELDFWFKTRVMNDDVGLTSENEMQPCKKLTSNHLFPE